MCSSWLIPTKMRPIWSPNLGGRTRTFLCCGPCQFYRVVSRGLEGLLTGVYRKFKAKKSTEGIEIELDSDTPFCSLISGQEESGEYLLYLSVTGEKLFIKEPRDPARQWELRSPSISLGWLLERVSADDLTEKRKEVLSWLLAKAVWQYYSSPWMLQPWNKERVHFLFERRRTDQGHEVAGIFVNEPLLSVSILPDKSGAEDTKAGSEPEKGTKSGPKGHPFHFVRKQIPLHQIPKILGLGVMLLEIQLGRSMESLRSEPESSQYFPQGKPNINTNYKTCKDFIKKPDFFADMEISDPLEALIKSCIQPQDEFMPHIRDEERIRERLYRLVNRLEVYISKRKPHNVKPLSLPRSLPPTCPPPTPAPLPAPQPAPQPQPLPQVKPWKPSRPGRTMAQMYTFFQVYSSPRHLQTLVRTRRQRKTGSSRCEVSTTSSRLQMAMSMTESKLRFLTLASTRVTPLPTTSAVTETS